MTEHEQAGPGRRAGSSATEPDREGTPNRVPGHVPPDTRRDLEEADPA